MAAGNGAASRRMQGGGAFGSCTVISCAARKLATSAADTAELSCVATAGSAAANRACFLAAFRSALASTSSPRCRFWPDSDPMRARLRGVPSSYSS
eukprot:3611064-Rhodomonas_salina.1